MSSTSLWIFASPAGGGAELDEVDAAASVAANRRHELVEVADIDCLDAPNGRITFANDLVVIRIEAIFRLLEGKSTKCTRRSATRQRLKS